MVATGVRPSSTGTADKAPYVAGETASFITNLASTRIGVMAFGIQNADADSFEAATLNVYVNGVNGNIGKGWTKFAVYETLNPTLTYKTGGMNQSDFAAVKTTIPTMQQCGQMSISQTAAAMERRQAGQRWM